MARLTWLTAIGLVAFGHGAGSATLDRGGVAVDVPDDWSRQEHPDATLLTYPYRQTNGVPGMAKILIVAPVRGPLATIWEGVARGLKALAADAPLAHGEGVGWSGEPLRWAQHCCRVGGVAAVVIEVGVMTGGSTEMIVLDLPDADPATQERAVGATQAIARSVRQSGAQAGMPPPSAGAGGLDGLYTNLRTSLTPNVFGGMDYAVRLDTLTLDPSGLLVRAVLADETAAARCARTTEACGTYAVQGGRIAITEQIDPYGRVEHRSEPFARAADGTLRIGVERWSPKTPFPAGATLSGTWQYQFASGGMTATTSGGVSVERSLTLRPDGRFARRGFASFASSNETSGARSSVAESHPGAEEAGRYALDSYRLTLTPDGRPPETASIFEADPNDGMLVIGGANYLKATR